MPKEPTESYQTQTKNLWFWYIISAFIVICTFILIFVLATNANQLAGFLGLNDSFQTSKVKSKPGLEKVKVSKVADGDTIELTDGRKVRYLNMDTPESKKPATPVQCYAIDAYEFNKSKINGREVWILPDKEDEDKYGRSLRFIFLNENDTDSIEKSLNADLVRRGYARTSIYKPNNTYQDIFYKLQKDAESQKIGLWGKCSKPFVE
jgi:micrococcal nuclease